MKKLGLFFVGCTPFLWGRLMDWALWTLFYDSFPSLLFPLAGLALLGLWAAAACLLGEGGRGPLATLLPLNLPALAVLVLLGVQERLLHVYLPGLVGIGTQLFFLPLLNLGSTLTAWLPSVSAFPAYCAAFLLLLVASLAGWSLARRRR